MAVIIAEIGQNHGRDMQLAELLIEKAKEYGADLVKFQLYEHSKLYSKDNPTPNNELTFDEAKKLFCYGKEIGIEVFFSVFDAERVKWCEELGVKRYKLAKTLKDQDTIKAVLATGKPVIASLYIPHLWLLPAPVKTLLCVSKYPASIADYHLDSYFPGTHYDGMSDHTVGLDAAKIALARGAQIIEKHFCIAPKVGFEAEWSMTPEELGELRRFADVVRG